MVGANETRPAGAVSEAVRTVAKGLCVSVLTLLLSVAFSDWCFPLVLAMMLIPFVMGRSNVLEVSRWLGKVVYSYRHVVSRALHGRILFRM